MDEQQIKQQQPIRFLVFSPSLRNGSLNTHLAKLAASIIEKNGVKVDFANMSEFDCPSFNQDLEANNWSGRISQTHFGSVTERVE